MTVGTRDPDVSAVFAEYALLSQTRITLDQLNAMAADRAVVWLAIAEKNAEKQARDIEDAKWRLRSRGR